MSATNTMSTAADFVTAVEELEQVITSIATARDRADLLIRHIVEMAKSDDNGGLPRLGYAVLGEAKSLAEVVRDRQRAEEEAGWEPSDLNDVRDLKALILLAAADEAGDAS